MAGRFLNIALGVALLVGWPLTHAASEEAGSGRDTDAGEVLRIPGLPPVRMPPGAHVYGQGQAYGQSKSGPGDGPSDADDDPRLRRAPMPDRGVDPGFGHRFGYPGGQAGSPGLPSTVVGPGGVVRPFPRRGQGAKPAPPKHVETAQERAARIRKALAPKPPLDVVRRHTLDDLYKRLAAAKDVDEAKGLATLIGSIWMRSGSDTANFLMLRATQAIDKKDYASALDVLDQLVELKPGWAEAWNKRASVRFYQGNLDGSMSDVEHVLKLEPKHFGALDGMGSILQRTGFNKRALEVFRRSLAIYPHQPEIEKIVDKLTLQVEGQGI